MTERRISWSDTSDLTSFAGSSCLRAPDGSSISLSSDWALITHPDHPPVALTMDELKAYIEIAAETGDSDLIHLGPKN